MAHVSTSSSDSDFPAPPPAAPPREVAHHYGKGMVPGWGTVHLIEETPQGFSFSLSADGEVYRDAVGTHKGEIRHLRPDEIIRQPRKVY